MEAPKNIYVHVKGDKVTNTWNSTWIGVHDVEYTRTDAFFKKLEEWLDEYISDMVDVDTRILVGSFKNYVEGKL